MFRIDTLLNNHRPEVCVAFQDYLVLLPSAYYEARILQQEITEPCGYQSRDGKYV